MMRRSFAYWDAVNQSCLSLVACVMTSLHENHWLCEPVFGYGYGYGSGCGSRTCCETCVFVTSLVSQIDGSVDALVPPHSRTHPQHYGHGHALTLNYLIPTLTHHSPSMQTTVRIQTRRSFLDGHPGGAYASPFVSLDVLDPRRYIVTCEVVAYQEVAFGHQGMHLAYLCSVVAVAPLDVAWDAAWAVQVAWVVHAVQVVQVA